ncbi:MAG: hypothetical protein WC477_03360 [Patescibacteria group bacterium]
MAFFFQFLPLLCAIANAGLFFFQVQSPNSYPWMIVFPPILTFGAMILMVWRKRRNISEWRAMIPLIFTLSASGYALLLSEGIVSHWIIPIFVGCATWYLLHLMFVSIFLPARYPVNGISHANLALVPVALWFTAYTSYGLMVFINVSRLIPPGVMTLSCFLLFYGTSYASGATASRWRWTLIGTWIGLQIGILINAMPSSMETIGALAALCGGYALRVRRYGIFPLIPKRMMLIEALSAGGLLVLILALAAWR